MGGGEEEGIRPRGKDKARRRETRYPTDGEDEGEMSGGGLKRTGMGGGGKGFEEFRKEGRSLDLSSIEGCS